MKIGGVSMKARGKYNNWNHRMKIWEHGCFIKFPSMSKGNIVENLVLIDVNIRRIPKENPRIP
jgi:hypothetical protein